MSIEELALSTGSSALEDRATGWLDEKFHRHFREILTHTAARYALVAPVYCLMPDHIHVLFWGRCDDSDAYLAARFLRKHTARELAPAHYQKQAYDHVLSENQLNRDAFEAICFYILENPVRPSCADRQRIIPSAAALYPVIPT